MRSKKALIGKIFLSIFIFVFLFIAYIGFSIYQAYSSFDNIKNELGNLKTNVQVVLETKDCEKVNSIYQNKENIFLEFNSVCKNPLLKWSISKIDAIPYKCHNKQALEENVESEIKKFEELCRGAQDFPDLPKNVSIEEIELEELDLSSLNP